MPVEISTSSKIRCSLLNLKNSIICTKSWCVKILAKMNNRNCGHCKLLKEKKSVVLSVLVRKINVRKNAIVVVAKALMPQVPSKASTPSPSKKLNAKNKYLFR